MRKCAVNEEHHNTVVQAEKKQEAQQKVEAHKEPIAEDFENSCSLLYIPIYATQLSSQALRPTEHNATPCCSYQLTNGILGWLQLSSIIVGLLSLQMYLGNEQMYLTLSQRKLNTWTFLKVYFAGWFKHLFEKNKRYNEMMQIHLVSIPVSCSAQRIQSRFFLPMNETKYKEKSFKLLLCCKFQLN